MTERNVVLSKDQCNRHEALIARLRGQATVDEMVRQRREAADAIEAAALVITGLSEQLAAALQSVGHA